VISDLREGSWVPASTNSAGRDRCGPGDALRIEAEVIDVRPSRSRPDQGALKVRTTTVNQRDEAVQVTIGILVVPRRPR
jgi:acyl dehydratase